MFSVSRPRAAATEWREAGEDGAGAGDATAGAAATGAAASGAGGGAQPAAAQQESRCVCCFLHYDIFFFWLKSIIMSLINQEHEYNIPLVVAFLLRSLFAH